MVLQIFGKTRFSVNLQTAGYELYLGKTWIQSLEKYIYFVVARNLSCLREVDRETLIFKQRYLLNINNALIWLSIWEHKESWRARTSLLKHTDKLKHKQCRIIPTLWLKVWYTFSERLANIHLKDTVLWKHSARLTFNLCVKVKLSLPWDFFLLKIFLEDYRSERRFVEPHFVFLFRIFKKAQLQKLCSWRSLWHREKQTSLLIL